MLGQVWQEDKVSTLRKHAYSNKLKISRPKIENFQIKKKKTLIFFICLLKTQIVGIC